MRYTDRQKLALAKLEQHILNQIGGQLKAKHLQVKAVLSLQTGLTLERSLFDLFPISQTYDETSTQLDAEMRQRQIVRLGS